MRAILLVLIMIIGIVAVAFPALPNTHGATGTSFDNVVIIAMENQNYASVMGTGSGTSSAPFIASLLAQSSTLPSYHGYGAAGRTINGCSAGCYTALISGSDQGIVDGYACCINAPTIADRMTTAGLTWQAYCESGCPRGNDHFPFTGFAGTSKSPSIFTGSTVSTATFVAAANSVSPPNLLWFTPTDSHNMHDNTVQAGDAYLHDFLVGSTGSLTNPASGSLLASNLFKPGQRTLLLLWWDEYDPAPILFYGSMVKQAFVSTGNLYDEYSILHLFEANWALPTLTLNDVAALTMSEIYGVMPPLQFATSFTALPSTPVVNVPVTFTAVTIGGALPYTISWNFGDSATATGVTVTHSYTTAQSFTVTETATDSSSPKLTATATSTIAVSSSLAGNYDSAWFINNCPGGTETITNGVLQTRQSTPGGGPNSYGYCTGQRGTFPWHSTVGTALPPGIQTVTASFNFLSRSLLPGSRYHIYIALYFQIPSSTSGTTTYPWLDTQSRVENIGGTDSPIGTTATYNPGDSFGWDLVTLQANPGQPGILIADVTQLCKGDLAAWGLSTNTQCALAGVEIGTEGYLVNSVNVDWTNVGLNTGPTPLTTSFTVTPSSPLVNTPATFSATALGGTSPYTISWNFGDGATGSGGSTTHTYSTTGYYTVSLTVKDSALPQATSSASIAVNVQTLAPLTLSLPKNQTVTAGAWINFTVAAASSNPGRSVTLSASQLPTGATFDPTTGAFSWKPSASQSGYYTITFIATDNSAPPMTSTKTMGVQVNRAASAPPGGSTGNSGGNTSGGCPLCMLPAISSNIWLFLVGGLLGLVTSLALLTIRARASLEHTKRRLNRISRYN